MEQMDEQIPLQETQALKYLRQLEDKWSKFDNENLGIKELEYKKKTVQTAELYDEIQMGKSKLIF